jgi:hypothetical protein
MDLYQEITELAIKLQIEDCFGCKFGCPSQKDHTCLDEFYYELALYQATELIKIKYNISADTDLSFGRTF